MREVASAFVQELVLFARCPAGSLTRPPARKKTSTCPQNSIGTTADTSAHPSPGWHTLTGPAFDASLGSRHGEDGEAVIILRAACLDGTYVAVAASSEHAGQIQGLDSLRLHLPEHGLTHGLKLTVECISQLRDGRYKLAQMDSDDCTNEQRFT